MCIPTVDQLTELPFLAIIALLSRCLRRVERLYELPESCPDREAVKRTVDEAIQWVERYAMTGRRGVFSGVALDRVDSAALEGIRATRRVADAVSWAVKAIEFQTNDCILDIAISLGMAEEAATRAGFVSEFRDATVADFRRLIELKCGDYPKDGKAIDPSGSGPLGPLWPFGDLRRAK